MRLEAPSLKGRNGIEHGFFTREGGVSGGIYAGLNCGLGSKDDAEHVRENRRRVASKLGVEAGNLISPYQYHSAEVVLAEAPWSRDDVPRADGVVTKTPGLAIAISTADCIPALFCDETAGVVGAAHAGWKGALGGVLEQTLAAMEGLGAQRSRITAVIGPAISQASYEVGNEFEQRFVDEDTENARFFNRKDPQSRPHFDLTGYARTRLEAAGTGTVEVLDVCTYCAEETFFSYRRACHRDEADYGRQISAIVIPR